MSNTIGYYGIAPIMITEKCAPKSYSDYSVHYMTSLANDCSTRSSFFERLRLGGFLNSPDLQPKPETQS